MFARIPTRHRGLSVLFPVATSSDHTGKAPVEMYDKTTKKSCKLSEKPAQVVLAIEEVPGSYQAEGSCLKLE